MYLLLDIWRVPAKPWAERARELLRAVPGVRKVQVFPEVGQAEVELTDDGAAVQEAVVAGLEAAGFGVRASCIPPPEAGSDYARYFFAGPDSSEGRWVD